VSIAEIVSAIREERLQDAARILMERECVVTVYACRLLHVQCGKKIAILASREPVAVLTYKLHKLLDEPLPAELSAKPCAGCPEHGGFPS
jgi:hypothetical protein